MDTCIKYLDNLKIKDEFTKSVINQFLAKGEKSLSNRQIEIITDKYINHKQATKYFKEHQNLNEFEKSLKSFFDKNGFLTAKQLSALLKKK